jgi:very-short-patch-repair endonuclease
MHVTSLLRSSGGIASRRQLVARGVSGGDLTRAVRTGVVLRPRQAHYALPSAPADARVAVRVGGRLAGPSAAASHGLWSGLDDRVHVAVPRHASRLRVAVRSDGSTVSDIDGRPVVVHWWGGSPAIDESCWRVTVLDCLRQMVTWCDTETAVACVDTALQAGLVMTDTLAAGLQRMGDRATTVLARCRHGSDSGVESLVRQRLARIGIEVDQQVRVTSVGPSDMRVRGRRGQALKLLIEVDGFAYHSTRASFDRDRAKDAEAAAAGYVTLRFSADQVVRGWQRVESRVIELRDLVDDASPSPLAIQDRGVGWS